VIGVVLQNVGQNVEYGIGIAAIFVRSSHKANSIQYRKSLVENSGPRNYSMFNKESMLNNNSNNNNNSTTDEEARKYAISTSSRIVYYIERIYQV
jgi:hypothetical protein